MEFLGTFLNKESNAPLYYQLYSHILAEIRTGGIPAGEKLPGKRRAAVQLGVSVNTVDEAYQMLAAEGYVEARPRSGFVVMRLAQQVPPPPEEPPEAAAPSPLQDVPGPWRLSFSSGELDPALFPRKMWNRLSREVLSGDDSLFARGEPTGDMVLREAIATYLRGFRGVRCEGAQVVVGAGLEVLIGMLVRLYAGRRFAVEDPGYPKTAHILRNQGAAMLPIAVDAEGMCPEQLEVSGAEIAYLTPSHQFPTGGVMPAGRRTALLRWASQPHHLIIEDDYDSEFRFDGRPLPCLQGLGEAGRVVYAGTFSRSLAPGLRVAYLVLPPAVLARWQASYGDYACTVSRPEQHTLARLMTEGHFARHLNRLRAAYKRRRDLLLAALGQQLPQGSYQLENTHTGLYFVLRLPGQNAPALAQSARAQGVRLRALDEYRSGTQNTGTASALVLGYGGLHEANIENAVHTLKEMLFN